ncbi:MAG: 50S ribosomal protein L29 [Desulfobacterales bacterium]|nr:MAG: 50S ribosomal protein L29 [Desulfobacterales bacterium]
MKMDEIRSLSADELRAKKVELQEELGKLSFQHRIRPLEDTSQLKKIKKDIARIETVKNSQMKD